MEPQAIPQRESPFDNMRFQCVQMALNRGWNGGEGRDLNDILDEADRLYRFIEGPQG